jgi:hypothetical protein
MALACERSQPAPEAREPAAAQNNEPIAGTPPGDLEQWVGDIRRGLESVRNGLGGDRGALQRQVLDLYVGRQEYLEMYYGPGGRMSPTEELAAAVKAAEDRFHVLIQLTGAAAPVEVAELEQAISALESQLDEVLRAAASSPTRLRAGQSEEKGERENTP